MKSFGLTLYLVQNRIIRNSIEIFYDDLEKKINLYEDSGTLTAILYEKEHQNYRRKLEEDSLVSQKNAEQIYKKVLEEYGDNDNGHDFARQVSDIDSIPYQLNNDKENLKIRIDDIGDAFNKSSLIALYGLLESETKKLCSLVQKQLSIKISYEHLKAQNYFKTALLYYALVLDIPIDNLKKFELKFVDLQYIRNRLVHGSGEFSEENKQLKKIVADSQKKLDLECIDNKYILRIKTISYLNSYFEFVKGFYRQLLWLIDERLEYLILRRRFKYLFGYLSKQVEVSNFSIRNNKKSAKEIKFEIINIPFQPELGCTVILSPCSKNQCTIENRIPNNQEIIDFAASLEERTDVLYDIFRNFCQHKETMQLKVVFW